MNIVDNYLDTIQEGGSGWMGVATGIKMIDQHIHAKEIARNRTIAAGVLAAAIIAASITIYKKYMSKEAKACKQYKGESNTKCRKMFKKKAIQERIKKLREWKPKCVQLTKNPKGCAKIIEDQIKQLQSKI